MRGIVLALSSVLIYSEEAMKTAQVLVLVGLTAALNFSSVSAQNANPSQPSQPAPSRKLPPGMMYVPGKILPVPRPMNTHVGPKHRIGELILPVPDNSLWFRYYKAGESAAFSGNKTLAHKYWMASLAELEKVKPNPEDDLMSVKLSALEQNLTYSYPSDWSKEKGSSEEIAKRREEQVSVLERMAQVNRRLVPKDTLLCQKSYERFDIAKKSYDKAIAESKSSSDNSH